MNDQFFEKAGAVALVAVLILACFKIVSPFLGALLWGGIIAISTWPLYERLLPRLKQRKALAASLLTIGLILVFVLPVSILIHSLSEHVASVSALAGELTAMTLPPAPAWLANAPLVGGKLNGLWLQASTDMPALLETARPAIKTGMSWILKQSGNLTLALLEFLLAIVLAGFLCANGEGAKTFADRLIRRFASANGVELVAVAGQTIRAVSVGVVGTALIQAVLSIVGFAVAGIPGTALLGVVCFLLAMMQVGTGLVWIPIVVWLGYHEQTAWAIGMLIWNVFINISDNFIKPYLISQGSNLPIPLIFIGVLGGLLAWGFIGIFVGPTLLVVSYTLLNSWLEWQGEDCGIKIK